MIPNTKISQTILEFGKDIILGLPENASKEEFEATMRVIVSAWNAVVIDSWNKSTEFEESLMKTLEGSPKEMIVIMKRLIKRKKKKFKSDLRGVGKYWVKEKNGEFVFGCEARVDVDKLKMSGLAH